MEMENYQFVATTVPGLQDVAGGEIERILGVRPKISHGRVSFEGELDDIYRVNLLARCVHKLLLVLTQSDFQTLDDLYRLTRQVDFTGVIDRKQTFAVRAKRFGTHGFTSLDVASKVGQAVIDSFQASTNVRLKVNLEHPDVELMAIVRDQEFLLGVNTTGESLHRRGYRVYNHAAANKTRLACGLIYLSGWRPPHPFLDVMCGGGTIPIEAALMARRIPLNQFGRDFSFKRLRIFSPWRFERVYREILEEVRWDLKVPIYGLDISQKHLRGAVRNAQSAGVEDTITFNTNRGKFGMNQYADSLTGPSELFIRGDYNGNGDALGMDNPLNQLSWQFNQPGSFPPASPYPDCGPDVNVDGLGPCYSEYCMGKGLPAYKPSVSVKGAQNRLEVGAAQPGEDGLVTVPVKLTNSVPLSGFEYTLRYDPKRLEALEVRNAGLETEGYDFFASYIADGKVKVGGIPRFDFSRKVEVGERVVAEVVFKVKGKLEMDAEVGIEMAELYDGMVHRVPTEWVSGVVKAGVSLPTEYALEQNYPNPFNATTVIRYSLPVDRQGQSGDGGARARTTSTSYVSLKVYNILGQVVRTLVDEPQAPGYYSVRWDGRDNAGEELASGIYIYRIRAGEFTQTRRMILLK